MANFENHQMTEGGWDALSQALAGKTLRFTRMAAGDGFLAEGADLAHATELVHHVMDIPLAGFTDVGGGRATVNGTLISSQVTDAFYLREVGLICTLDDGPEILYSINNAGDQADYVPSRYEQTAVVNAIEVHIVIGQAENIEINISTGQGDGGERIQVVNVGDASVGPGLFLGQAGSLLQFKRLREGDGITLSDTGQSVAISAVAVAPPASIALPAGMVFDYAGLTLPEGGYLWADGAAHSRVTFSALFAAIGTKYGAGDGSTTFNVPDGRGRICLGAGQGPGLSNRLLGELSGAETHTLSIAEMPSHNHSTTQTPHNHQVNYLANAGTGAVTNAMWATSPSTVSTSGSLANITVNSTGSGTAHPNMQPSLTLNKIIKT